MSDIQVDTWYPGYVKLWRMKNRYDEWETPELSSEKISCQYQVRSQVANGAVHFVFDIKDGGEFPLKNGDKWNGWALFDARTHERLVAQDEIIIGHETFTFQIGVDK